MGYFNDKRFSVLQVVGMLCVVMMGVSGIGFATVPHTFMSGSTISSSEMNANFAALEARIVALEAKLNPISLETVDGYSSFVFSGVNVHVRSGCGSTNDTAGGCGSLSGLGNLIIGYNEDNASDDVRTGSHNLVIGAEHTYTSYGGLVAGWDNAITNTSAVVSGGNLNTASGLFASVSGGQENLASGDYASVSAGQQNTASAIFTTVSGGRFNDATYTGAAVSGGNSNLASGLTASVSGGHNNISSSTNTAVSGGGYNIAGDSGDTVSGGIYRDSTINPGSYEHLP